MLRRFLLAWRIARDLPFDRKWEVEWSKGDSEWLRSAFSTQTGSKFWKLLQHEVGASAVWAVNRIDSVRSCGYAAGVAYVIGMIEQCLPQKEKATPEEGYEIETSMLDQ
jgi:hypothetical protein